MQDTKENQGLVEVIDSGAYFEQAFDWYANKYLAPFVHRSYQIMITAITSLFMLLIISLAATDDYIEKLYPFPVYTENTVSEITRINSISNSTGIVNDEITQYLLEQYVIRRESYNPEHLDAESVVEKMRYMKHNSTWKIFQEYKKHISSTNFFSPFVQYKLHTSRNIKVTDVYLVPTPGNYQKAQVKFTATEDGVNLHHTTNWIAEIEYISEGLDNILASGSKKLHFQVSKYDLYKN